MTTRKRRTARQQAVTRYAQEKSNLLRDLPPREAAIARAIFDLQELEWRLGLPKVTP